MHIFRTISFFILLFNLQLAYALSGLNIEITQGIKAAQPIAIVDFGKGENVPDNLINIADIVRSDLRNSGFFNTLNPEGFAQRPHELSKVNFSYWRRLEAEELVVGRIHEVGQNRFDITFELLDIFGKGNTSSLTRYGNKQVVLAQSYNNVALEHLRALAHHISDKIFEKLVGIRGAFSTRIAYVVVSDKGPYKRYYLEVADSDGHNSHTLITSPEPLMSPAWSPDGKQLAFVSFENKRAEIYTVELGTGQRRLISKFPGINGAPAWSPDGSKLALVLSKSGHPKLYLYDIKKHRLSQLTHGVSIDTEPHWTPNGKNIIFTSNRGGKPQVYKLSLRNKKIKRLTFVGNYNARPSLSADGKRLVMIHQDSDGSFNIAVQDIGRDEVLLLTRSRLAQSPTISPNGVMVLYGSQDGSKAELGAVSIDGRVKLRLPAREGSVQEPAWSPFL